MAHYEYRVVPAPRRGEKVRGVRAAEDRFAIALESVMNAQAAEGWEYQRTETLPAEEREGLMGKATVFQNMMVFRRPRAAVTAPEQTVPLIEDKREEMAGSDDAADDAPVARGDDPVDPPLTATDPPEPAPDVTDPEAPQSDAPLSDRPQS